MSFLPDVLRQEPLVQIGVFIALALVWSLILGLLFRLANARRLRTPRALSLARFNFVWIGVLWLENALFVPVVLDGLFSGTLVLLLCVLISLLYLILSPPPLSEPDDAAIFRN